ncbi:MAG TPA: ribonuclease H [Gemmatimonadaceae bacterium]|jgi:ribonuclease HI
MSVMPDLPLLSIYADESCLGNGREGENPGGAAGVVEFVRGGVLTRWDYWSSEPATTNNRMALRSVIDAFTFIARKGKRFRVCFTSDSQYLVKGMSEWVFSWIERGWRRKGGEIENLELWREAVELVRPHKVEWQWVRGHNGQPQNEYADSLATRAARELDASNGLVPSGFEAWLGTERLLGRDHSPAPFPESAHFRPVRPFPVGTSPIR